MEPYTITGRVSRNKTKRKGNELTARLSTKVEQGIKEGKTSERATESVKEVKANGN